VCPNECTPGEATCLDRITLKECYVSDYNDELPSCIVWGTQKCFALFAECRDGACIDLRTYFLDGDSDLDEDLDPEKVETNTDSDPAQGDLEADNEEETDFDPDPIRPDYDEKSNGDGGCQSLKPGVRWLAIWFAVLIGINRKRIKAS